MSPLEQSRTLFVIRNTPEATLRPEPVWTGVAQMASPWTTSAPGSSPSRRPGRISLEPRMPLPMRTVSVAGAGGAGLAPGPPRVDEQPPRGGYADRRDAAVLHAALGDRPVVVEEGA